MVKILKIIKGVLVASMASMLMIMPAMAGNSGYTVSYMVNSGQTFNVFTDSYNTKAVTGRTWVVTPSYLYYSDTQTGSYGVGHALFTYANRGGIGASSNTAWAKSATKTYAGWKSGEGKAGVNYYIGARLDDVLSGFGVSKGSYNADSY